LGDLVAEAPARAALFDGLGLDYCCHGQRTLLDACTAAGLDVDAVAGQLVDLLGAVDAAGSATERGDDLRTMTEQIVATHHRYLRQELPALEALALKVEGVHGENHPELADLRAFVTALRADLEPHMDTEEMLLFPAIGRLVEGQREFPFESVENPIRMMETEHEQAGDVLVALRRISGQYTAPADGCASYRSLYARLEHLEADTHLHIHKENNVLFPLVRALEVSPAG
jgi:regulator of cell morphogenesis and NO signaling